MAVPETLSLRLSYELAHIADRGEFLRVASDAVSALVPADQLGWLAVDTGEDEAEIYGTGGIDRPEIVQALARWAGAHPMLLSYQAAPEDMAPLRMSDLMAVRAWRSHPVYSEVYSSLGAVYQICVAVVPYRDRAGAGWGFNRTGRDFTDNELELAARLQPTLMALNQASCLAFGQHASVQSEARLRAGLTAREGDILDLLAGGLTATAIGHACRISPATVRKHLEHIYAKLGCSDRLLAVERARRLGLLSRVSRLESARG
jgi:DNA-binding CsgD family transcriptional regulator